MRTKCSKCAEGRHPWAGAWDVWSQLTSTIQYKYIKYIIWSRVSCSVFLPSNGMGPQVAPPALPFASYWEHFWGPASYLLLVCICSISDFQPLITRYMMIYATCLTTYYIVPQSTIYIYIHIIIYIYIYPASPRLSTVSMCVGKNINNTYHYIYIYTHIIYLLSKFKTYEFEVSCGACGMPDG